MSYQAEIILDMVSREEKPIVSKIIKEAESCFVCCASTAHRALLWLAENEFIHMKTDEGDLRKKFCSIAQRGTIYLKTFD
jgi:hypothetical protein